MILGAVINKLTPFTREALLLRMGPVLLILGLSKIQMGLNQAENVAHQGQGLVEPDATDRRLSQEGQRGRPGTDPQEVQGQKHEKKQDLPSRNHGPSKPARGPGSVAVALGLFLGLMYLEHSCV